MESIINILVSATLFTTSLFGLNTNDFLQTDLLPQQDAPVSVEFGLSETSPRGEKGGFAMPASACSQPHPGDPVPCPATDEPKITAVPPIVRKGEVTKITWDPNGNIYCNLSANVLALKISPDNPTTVPNSDAVGSRNDRPNNEKKYTIYCANTEASVTVRVLPVIQET